MQPGVLIVGCGPAGLTAAAALSRQDIRMLAITKHPQLSPTPRAHVTNQRTFEVLRDLGIEQEALELATPYERMPDELFMRSLTGPEFGRIKGLAVDDNRNRTASPCTLADLPQHLLEPLLYKCAQGLGADIRFNTELISFIDNGDEVTAQIPDRSTGELLSIHFQYMIGADGAKSKVAADLKLPFQGPGRVGSSANILFQADLSSYVSHRPGLLYFLIRTTSDHGGPGLGILRCVKPWTSWLMIKGYEAGQQTVTLTRRQATGVIREYLGLPNLDVHITGIDHWNLNSMCATNYQLGRVFCMGDAVHRHVPSNGLGSNTAIQDACNLAWKLAFVLQGKAGAQLLATYSGERVPVGQHVVARATNSMESYSPILRATGALEPDSAHSVAELALSTEAGAKRRFALSHAIHEKVHEFQARGIELNHCYQSTAILTEGQIPPKAPYDIELYYRPTSCPGAHLPHAWVQKQGHRLSTFDLAGKGAFTLFTGIGGHGWIAAAHAASHRFGIAITTVSIGPGCPVEDLYFEWVARRGIEDDGCLLVRPDLYIAWRRNKSEHQQELKLHQALNQILARPRA